MRIYKLLLFLALSLAVGCTTYVNDGLQEPTNDQSIIFDAELSSLYNSLRIDVDYDDLSWIDNESRPYIGVPYTSKSGGKVYITNIEAPEGFSLESSVIAPIATSDGLLKVYVGGTSTESKLDTFKFTLNFGEESTPVELKVYILGATDPASEMEFYNLQAFTNTMALYEGGVPLRAPTTSYTYAYANISLANVWSREFYLEITEPAEFEFYQGDDSWDATYQYNPNIDFDSYQDNKLKINALAPELFDADNANIVLRIPVRIKEGVDYIKNYGDDNVTVVIAASYADWDYVNEQQGEEKSVTYSRNLAVKAINDMNVTSITNNLALAINIEIPDNTYIYVDYEYGEQRTVKVETTFTDADTQELISQSEISAQSIDELQLDITDGTLYDKEGQIQIEISGTPTLARNIKAEVKITNITAGLSELIHSESFTLSVGTPNAETDSSQEKEEL